MRSRRSAKFGEHLAALAQQGLVVAAARPAQMAAGCMKRWPRVVLAGVACRAASRRHTSRAEQHHQPVHGPHELGLARAPAHALRDRQRIERRLHDAGQQLDGVGAPGFSPFEEQELALAFLDAPAPRRDAAALGEGQRGARRRAAASKAALTGGPRRLIC
jgi:hypothetical protein